MDIFGKYGFLQSAKKRNSNCRALREDIDAS